MNLWRPEIRGGAVRFLTGTWLFFSVWYLLALALQTKRLVVGPPRFLALVNLCLCLTAGYVAGLGILRPTVHSASGVASRSSVATGFVAAFLLLVLDFIFELNTPGVGMLAGHHGPRLAMEIGAFVVGVVTTVAIFMGWLSRNEQEAEELAQAIDSINEGRQRTR